LSEADVGVEGVRARACVTLSREASAVWGEFSKAEKIRVASIFSELVLYYARTKRLPVASVDVIMHAADVVKKAYDVCLREKGELEKDVDRLRGELEACRSGLREAQARLTEAESKLKREVEELRAKLEKAQERVEQLEAANEKLNMSVRITALRLETLKFVCKAYETLLRVARSEAERAELDLLCRGEQ